MGRRSAWTARGTLIALSIVLAVVAVVVAIGANAGWSSRSVTGPSATGPLKGSAHAVPTARRASLASPALVSNPARPPSEDPLAAAVDVWQSRQSGKTSSSATGIADANPFENAVAAPPVGRIDELVFARLEELDIEPAAVCSDAVFVRRVYLDVIGTLPTAEQVRRFLEEDNPQKRPSLVDELLQRPEFADYWALKWSDLLRVKAEFPINLWPNAAQAYHRWLRNAVRDNLPYDRFVRELLTASGSNFRVPQVNFYRALQSRQPQGVAKAVAQAFMGSRAEQWPEERLLGTSLFFAKVGYKPTGEWKEEIIIFDPAKAVPQVGDTPPVPLFPDGTAATLPPDQDPRQIFANWLITPQNPWFSRHIVNRLWYWLLGRGIVHEPDDIRAGNPPSNPALLNWLASELVAANYDLRHIYRLILNSRTYQLSCIPKSDHPEGPVNFACYPLRRLDAEVLIDALGQITGTTESYSSMIPEPFTFIPEDVRSIALPDGSISSTFLEMFGRPSRDTGLESERNNRMTAAQRLHLLNSTHIRRKVQEGPALQALFDSGADAGRIAETLYLTILSRFPTEAEKYAVEEYCRSKWGGQTVAWALINSNEFLHRH